MTFPHLSKTTIAVLKIGWLITWLHLSLELMLVVLILVHLYHPILVFGNVVNLVSTKLHYRSYLIIHTLERLK